jgi:glycosyltransferase involved in cell wall biosynthesis
MTRVGWLADDASQIGGAELTQAEFRDAAPEGVEIIDCPPGGVDQDCDAYVVQNCVKYDTADLAVINDRPAVKYWHDVGPWLQPGVRELLDQHATPICCSPIQAEYMGLEAALVPPPVDLGRFEDAAKVMNGNRAGAVSIGSWRNYGKAPHRAAEWAGKDGIDFFGDGVLAPSGSAPVRYEDMPALMAKYQTFVFLPTVIEPFGRLVAEAWAAGCELVTNRLVGALHWIENDPDAIDTAASDFWQIALRDQ